MPGPLRTCVVPSYRDSTRYSFTHAGKDGITYPVDRKTYNQSIELLSKAINKTKFGLSDKYQAFQRLDRIRRE